MVRFSPMTFSLEWGDVPLYILSAIETYILRSDHHGDTYFLYATV